MNSIESASVEMSPGVRVFADGSHETSITENGSKALRELHDLFTQRFGRPPGQDDPLFWDDDFDVPTRYTGNKFEKKLFADLMLAIPTMTPCRARFLSKVGLVTEENLAGFVAKDRADMVSRGSGWFPPEAVPDTSSLCEGGAKLFWVSDESHQGDQFVVASSHDKAIEWFRNHESMADDEYFDDEYFDAEELGEIEGSCHCTGQATNGLLRALGAYVVPSMPAGTTTETLGKAGRVAVFQGRVFEERDLWSWLHNDSEGMEKNVESYITDWLITVGSTEVQTQVKCISGVADIVTNELVIEVKRVLDDASVKSAVGQSELNACSIGGQRRPVVAGPLPSGKMSAAVVAALASGRCIVCPRYSLTYPVDDSIRRLVATRECPDGEWISVRQFAKQANLPRKKADRLARSGWAGSRVIAGIARVPSNWVEHSRVQTQQRAGA